MSERNASRQPVIGPAPGRLELVRAFVNTLDVEAGTDELSSPGALISWLGRRGLAGAAGAGTRDDVRRAVALREALREVLQAHVTSQSPPAGPLGDLRSVAAGLATRLEVGDDGVPRPVPDGSGPNAGLAALLLIAAEAATAGTWSRLKVCSADDCRWAFYDRSPTRSGCWCSMAGCGTRAKSRAYRQRAAASREVR
jgi:predicted RNA-binding Zn ribbon-like protein